MRKRFVKWLIKVLRMKGVHLHGDPIRKEKSHGDQGSTHITEER